MLTKLKNQLLIEEPFLGYLLLKLFFKENINIPTMRVDGITLEYSPAFVKSKTESEIKVILIHELLHCILRHITRSIGHITEISQYAADYATNAHIVHNTPYTLPADGLYDIKYKDMSYEAIYHELLEECNGNPDSDMTEQAAEMGEFTTNPGGASEATDNLTIQEFWETNINEAEQFSKSIGRGSSNVEELIKEFRPSQLNWKFLLKKFLTKHNKIGANWNLPSRRARAIGKYLPSKNIGKNLKDLVIAIDTSLSMTSKEFEFLLGEINEILTKFKYKQIHLIQCDTAVQSYKIFKPKDKLTGSIVGRGGTDFEPVFELVKEEHINPECLIYFTDMGAWWDFEYPKYPVLWIDTSTGGETKAPFGQTIALNT